MRSISVALIALFVVGTAMCQTVPAAPKSFTVGVSLSTGGEGWESSVAIDGSGNSLALWDQRTTSGVVIDKVWSKSRLAGSGWSGKAILSGSLGTTYVYPTLRISSSGAATAIWSDVGGLWAADRSSARVWSASQLLLPGVSGAIFVMNAQGDAALLWGSGGGRTGPTQLNAMRRSAGSAWGAQEVVATGTSVGYNHAFLADNGDLAITWESYSAVCNPGRPCTFSNFVLHAARELKGSTTWQDSGALTPSENLGHSAWIAVDSSGRAGVVYLSAKGTLSSITQSAVGVAWTTPVVMYSSTSFVIAGLSIDTSGNETLALSDYSTTAQPVMAINGSVINNTWGTPVTVSGTDQSPTQAIFAGSSSGAAALSWSAGNPNYTNNTIRASARTSTTGAWTAPKTISPAGVQMASPESVAVNPAGNAIVIFSAFNGTFSVHTEYASIY